MKRYLPKKVNQRDFRKNGKHYARSLLGKKLMRGGTRLA